MTQKQNPSLLNNPQQRHWLPWLVGLLLFMDNLDASVINIAIPHIADNLNTSALSLKLAVTCYLLSLGVFIPISGWLAERFGLKRILLLATTLFGLGSLAAGLASSLTALIMARLLQGLGGAMTIPVGRLLLLRVFPKKELVNVLTFIVIPALFAPALGPIVGAVIISMLSWRWIFFMNIPFILLSLAIISYLLRHRPAIQELPTFDWIGFALFAPGVALLIFGASALGQHVLSMAIDGALAAAGLSLLIVYSIYQYFVAHPLINRELFCYKSFTIGNTFGVLARLAYGSTSFLLALFFQLVLGFSVLHAAMILSCVVIGMIISKIVIKKVLKVVALKKVLLVNGVIVSGMFLVIATFDDQTSMLYMISLLAIYGFFISNQMTCLQMLNYTDIPDHLTRHATSLASAIQNIAKSLAIAVAAICLQILSPAAQSHIINPQTLQAFQLTFMIMACFSFAGTLGYSLLSASAGEAIRQR